MNKLLTFITALTLTATTASAAWYDIPGADNRGYDLDNYSEWDVLHKMYDDDFNKSLEFIRSVGTDGKVQYFISINGGITKDMADKFEAYFYRIGENGDWDYATRIFLNSPGGDANAGIQMAQAILDSDNWVATTVTKGQECHSSCVVIFNAAQYRSVNFNGILGIHAPYTDDFDCSDNEARIADMRSVVNPRVSVDATNRYIEVVEATCGPTKEYGKDTAHLISGGEGFSVK